MKNPANHLIEIPGSTLRREAFSVAMVCAWLMTALLSAEGQTFTVIHNFSGGADGGTPEYVSINPGGVVYGITEGTGGGTAFKLKQTNSSWVLSTLFDFVLQSGVGPGVLTVSSTGSLYGTTSGGGRYAGGTAYILSPPPVACASISCHWTQTIIHQFMGSGDGFYPSFGPLLFDQSGNAYGATADGGAHNYGTVYELVPSGGNWTESILYSFTGRPNAANPIWNVVPDGIGNFYGAASGGMLDWGSIYELSPSGSGWTESTLYSFQPNNDIRLFPTGLVRDAAGNLYGATSYGGAYGYGVVFEYSPSAGGTISALYAFSGYGVTSALTIGPDGSLYGTSEAHGLYGKGAVFKLTHTSNGWRYTSLHDFTGGSDGAYPYCNVVFDSNGNLYGTAAQGGAHQNGVAWQIAP